MIANEVSQECTEMLTSRGDRRYLCKPVQILVRMDSSTWWLSFGGTSVFLRRFENGCCWSRDVVLGLTLKLGLVGEGLRTKFEEEEGQETEDGYL